jgi:hypothetical protein
LIPETRWVAHHCYIARASLYERDFYRNKKPCQLTRLFVWR